MPGSPISGVKETLPSSHFLHHNASTHSTKLKNKGSLKMRVQLQPRGFGRKIQRGKGSPFDSPSVRHQDTKLVTTPGDQAIHKKLMQKPPTVAGAKHPRGSSVRPDLHLGYVGLGASPGDLPPGIDLPDRQVPCHISTSGEAEPEE
jgi:hypothetical protein